MTDERKHLYYLHELSDYKVASGDPDVRGWPVKDSDNRVIGKVDNLLVNKDREQVVYLDVEVDKSIIEANHDPYGRSSREDVHEFINKDGEEHVIIPIGLASLNEDENYVYTDRIDRQTFAETKRVEKGSHIDRDYEVVVLETYGRNRGTDTSRSDRSFTDRNEDRVREEERRARLDEERRREEHYDEDRVRANRDVDRDATYDHERARNRYPDDDSFYDRDEFDRRNFRRR
ncbi:MAG TPA: PRC-barrel domain-containing protein [Salinimicrobium sp.]|nr:PRC-barrel domain-containing protein [Salinimicrobium sp.]